ncbi:MULTISPECIES: hypothetical protein [unclassified Cellulophaga]|uniref:hypothetical protein n=1 Tax=unclassified Cellulophaga TaxID=2634405 RepID=UPI0026E13A1B|nr:MULTISPECIES: hypothetical protein [unclassified Cellulophaga]MDO6490748.1 hypothetical protein [Cellulophaga sp. 2_MG-2023]MDO6494058.1 hypothetical protein [Cellulophaga sp. 3_MG-2023]
MKTRDKIVYAVLFVICSVGLYFGLTDSAFFDQSYAQEDGLVEYGTALMLFIISLICIYRLFTISKGKSITWKIGTLLFAILFLFGAGEEVSWGQRIFEVQSSEFFIENNAQGETNLHNMVVGETKVNKLIFSQLLMVVMVLYLIVSPFLYRKQQWFKNLVNMFAVPIVKWHHTIAFLAATALVISNPSGRTWEVYELVFGAIFILIFLAPLNDYIFKKEN